MKSVKRFLQSMFAGGLIGTIFFAWFSPDLIDWYSASPVNQAISCSPSIQWAIAAYRKVTLIGTGLGMVIAALLFLAFGKSSKPGSSAPLPGVTEVK